MLRTSTITLLLLLTLADFASGQDPDARTLNGYRFPPPSGLGEPFLTNHFSMSTQVSHVPDVDIAVLEIGTTPPDTLFELSGDLLYVGATIGYQRRIHPRWAVRAGIGGGSRVGSNSQAILAQGVRATTAGELGVAWQGWRHETWLMTLDVRGIGGTGIGVDLVRWITQFVEKSTAAGLVSSEHILGGDAGVNLAWAPVAWAGATALGRVGISNGGSRDRQALWKAGVAGSVDWRRRGGPSVGNRLSLEFDRLSLDRSSTGTDFGISFGTYYTGQENVSIGLELGWRRTRILPRDILVHPLSATVTVRNYF